MRLRAPTIYMTCIVVGVCGIATPAAATAPTPSVPGSGYVLDWENSADWTVPAHPPAGWAAEYQPGLVHADGQPQVRVAYGANGDPVRAGTHALRFELDKSDPQTAGSNRAELGAEAPIEPRGVERWYGLSTYLPSSWAFDNTAEAITQWHQTGGDCTAGCSPPLSIFTQNGHYFVSQNWQKNAAVPGDWSFVNTDIGAYTTGVWTDWVVHVKWSTGSDGLLEMWKNGVKIPEFSHKVGRTDDFGDQVHGNYLKIGIYKWKWATPPAVTNRVLFVDEIRTADATGGYNAVAPPVTPGHLTITSALQVTPGSGSTATVARFTVVNDGASAITVPYFLAGARNAAGANTDFPASPAVTLLPGQSYVYQGSRVLAAGNYTGWPSYYDGTNWHDLAAHTAFTDS